MMQPFGKLALREKGKWWVASLAPSKGGNPDNFTEIGRIRVKLVMMNPMLKEQFITMMKAAFDTACREALGETPEWPHPPQPAKD